MVESRPVRRKTRLEAKLADEDSEGSEDQPTHQHHLRVPRKTVSKAAKDDDVDKDDKHEKQLKEDPLIKRLRSSLLADKVKKEAKEKEEKVKAEKQQVKKELVIKAEVEDESSESREGDREPEPPPSDERLLDTGGRELKIKTEPKSEEDEKSPVESVKVKVEPQQPSTSDAKSIPPPRPNGELKDSDPKKKSASDQPQSTKDEGLKKEPEEKLDPEVKVKIEPEEAVKKTSTATTTTTTTTAEKKETEQPSKSSDKVVESSSKCSKELLVAPSSRDSGTVLERLSPLRADGRSLLLQQHQQEEQERSRHNESPVILVERLNKPPPTAQQHHQATSHHHPHHQPPPGSHHYHYPTLQQQQQHHQQRYEHHAAHVHTAHQLNQALLEDHRAASGDDARGGGLMEVEAGGAGSVSGIGVAGSSALLARSAAAYADSGSDSGVSSLRSAGSGDERSGSRSSALSAEEAAASSTTSTTSSTPNPVPGTASATPARIWHVQSVQHTSLLMAHPQSSAAQPPGVPPVGYQSGAGPGPPPGHPHHPSLAPQEMLWRPPARFMPLPPSMAQQPSLGEVLERDRHERILRLVEFFCCFIHCTHFYT